MARPAPEAGAGGLPRVPRIPAPPRELDVGEDRPGVSDRPHRDSEPLERVETARLVPGDERERQREEDDEERLNLEEPEEAPIRVWRPTPAQLLVAAVLLLAEDAVDEEVGTEPEPPERREHRREDAVAGVAVGEQRVDDRAARDEHSPGDVDVARVADANLDDPHQRHRRRGEEGADEQPPDRLDQASSSHRR